MSLPTCHLGLDWIRCFYMICRDMDEKTFLGKMDRERLRQLIAEGARIADRASG